MVKRLAACLLSVLISGVASAQDHPDFSGRWILTGASEALPGVAPSLTVRQTSERVGLHGKPFNPPLVELAIERNFSTGVQSAKIAIGINGGIVGGIVAGGDAHAPRPESHWATRWEGDRIVIERGSYSNRLGEPGPFTERGETWWLSDRDTLIIEVTVNATGVPRKTAVFTYSRLAYEQFIALDIDERRAIFSTLDPASKTMLVRTHGERWLASHRAGLSARQIGIVQAFIDFVPALFSGDDASIKREFELTKAIKCAVGDDAFAEAFAILHPHGDRRKSWRDMAYEWIEWFEECVR